MRRIILTHYDKAEARVLMISEPDGVRFEVKHQGDKNPTVQKSVSDLVLLTLNLAGQNDLFDCANQPLFGAQILVRQCNEIIEITPVYERELPNEPPYSRAELMAGRVLTEYHNGVARG
jgi:hypothetical protein